MAEFRSDSVDELIANFSEEQFARAQDCMERRARETAPGETTPLRQPEWVCSCLSPPQS